MRIQRRLLTKVTRARYLRQLRAHKQEQHRLLAVRRRETLRKTLTHFSEEEIDAFRLLFASADAAQLGLVSHTAIAQAVYDLGVHVPATKVRELLEDFDPAYADLVDFEHFLYGMHCVRVYHQQLQTQEAEVAEQPKAKRIDDEKLVSSSDRFGPRADPRAELLVKRQNLLRELRDRRESLAHKLMRKVSGKLPPLMQRGKNARAGSIDEGDELQAEDEAATVGDQPTGTYVFWQNRKLSPKKRALESVLKKKHQARLQSEKRQRDEAAVEGYDAPTTARTAVELDAGPRPKTSTSPAKRALKTVVSKRAVVSRGNTATARAETAVLPQPTEPVTTAPSTANSEEEDKSPLNQLLLLVRSEAETRWRLSSRSSSKQAVAVTWSRAELPPLPLPLTSPSLRTQPQILSEGGGGQALRRVHAAHEAAAAVPTAAEEAGGAC